MQQFGVDGKIPGSARVDIYQEVEQAEPYWRTLESGFATPISFTISLRPGNAMLELRPG